MKFVEERKIPINLKYHLLPRVKGFAATLGHLQKNRKTDTYFVICKLIFFHVFKMQTILASTTASWLLAQNHQEKKPLCPL